MSDTIFNVSPFLLGCTLQLLSFGGGSLEGAARDRRGYVVLFQSCEVSSISRRETMFRGWPCHYVLPTFSPTLSLPYQSWEWTHLTF